MNLTNFSVKNYQFTLVMFIMAVVVGAVTLFTMPRAEDPQINPPQFPIVVVYPGTNPLDMEELVVEPIENKLYELENIDKIITTIEDLTGGLVTELAEYFANLIQPALVMIKVLLFHVEKNSVFGIEVHQGAVAFIPFGHKVFAGIIPVSIGSENRNLRSDIVRRILGTDLQGMRSQG